MKRETVGTHEMYFLSSNIDQNTKLIFLSREMIKE